MKFTIGMLCLVVALSWNGLAFGQDADDVKWINQCIRDNKDEGAKASVVRKYCECMNSKMDASETRSITQWEKTHTKERDECSRKAGWR
jgi:hypothetical protein